MRVFSRIPTVSAPLDAGYRWSRYRTERDTRAIALEPLTWPELAETLRADARRHTKKLGAPALSPGLLREGATRGGDAVVRVEAIGLDVDGVSRDVWRALLDHLANADLAGLTYSTFSHGSEKHGPDKVCARVLLPLSRPLAEAPLLDTPRLLRALNAQLGGILDSATFDPSRLFFTPRRLAPSREGWIELLDGTRALDTDALLAMAPHAPEPRAVRSGGAIEAHAGGALPSREADAQLLNQASAKARDDVAKARALLARADASDRQLWIACGHALARELGALGWTVWRDWSLTADNADLEHELWARWSTLRISSGVGAAGWHTLYRAAGLDAPIEAKPLVLPQGARVLRPSCGQAADVSHARELLAHAAEVALGVPSARGADDAQLAQVAGALVLVAPPGAGKTHAITEAIAKRVLADKGARVLYVTRSHRLRQEVAHTLREAIARLAPADVHDLEMPRVQLDAPRAASTCDGSPQTWPSLQRASRARSGGAAALCIQCLYNPLSQNYGGSPCTWGRSRDTEPAQVEVITHARYALWARATGGVGAPLPLVWSWAALREAARQEGRVRPVLRATLETWRVEVEPVLEGDARPAWSPPEELVWHSRAAVLNDEGEVIRAASATPDDDTKRRLRESIAAWWGIDDEDATDDELVIRAALAHDAARLPYDVIVIDEDLMEQSVCTLDLDFADVSLAWASGLLEGDAKPLLQALAAGKRVELAPLIEGLSVPDDKVCGAWACAVAAWTQGDTIGAQAALERAVPDTLGQLWRVAAGTSLMYASWDEVKGGRLHLRAPQPLPSALPRTLRDEGERLLARRIVQLDATASPHVTRALWGADAVHYEIALARPKGVHITHIEGDSSSRIWRGGEGHQASAAQRAVRAIHAAFDGDDTLHIATRRSLDHLGAFEGPQLHHNGSEARGSNKYQHLSRVIIDAWHVPQSETAAMGEVLRAQAGDDDDHVAGWREVARRALEHAPVQQALHRVRPHLSERTEVFWSGVLPPESVLGASWTADVTVSASVLVWDVTGYARGFEVQRAALSRLLERSPDQLVTTLDGAEKLRAPEQWGARRLDRADEVVSPSSWRLDRREHAQVLADAVGARLVDVRSSSGGMRFAVSAGEVTPEAVSELLDSQPSWSWCEVEGVRQSRVEEDRAVRIEGLDAVQIAEILAEALDAGAGRNALVSQLAKRANIRYREAFEALRLAGGVEVLRELRRSVRERDLVRLDPYAAQSGVSRDVLAWHERELERELAQLLDGRAAAANSEVEAPREGRAHARAFATDGRGARDVLSVDEVKTHTMRELAQLLEARLGWTTEEAQDALQAEKLEQDGDFESAHSRAL